MQPTLTEVTLDGVHRTLLLLLLRDQGRVLQTTAGIAAEVAASDVFCLAPIKAVVQVGCCWLMHHLLLREPLASSLWLFGAGAACVTAQLDPQRRGLSTCSVPACLCTFLSMPAFRTQASHVHAYPMRRAALCQLVAATDCALFRSSALRFIRSQSTQAAEQREKRSPGSQRGLLRTYASLAVLRQTALLLRHYGIRCAHLYLRHSVVRSSAGSEMQCEPIEPTQRMPAAVFTSCSWCCMLALQGGRGSAPACRRSQPRPTQNNFQVYFSTDKDAFLLAGAAAGGGGGVRRRGPRPGGGVHRRGGGPPGGPPQAGRAARLPAGLPQPAPGE